MTQLDLDAVAVAMMRDVGAGRGAIRVDEVVADHPGDHALGLFLVNATPYFSCLTQTYDIAVHSRKPLDRRLVRMTS